MTYIVFNNPPIYRHSQIIKIIVVLNVTYSIQLFKTFNTLKCIIIYNLYVFVIIGRIFSIQFEHIVFYMIYTLYNII